MTKSERIAWFRSKQFPRKIDFEKEISGTVYTVRSHFSADATETLREKTERILKQK
ncbi:MAG: transposon-encoded TnpW family protein [Clostridia bacterium]|nr:transposon-encoded TnpW family protein [Clostridia bacterium]